MYTFDAYKLTTHFNLVHHIYSKLFRNSNLLRKDQTTLKRQSCRSVYLYSQTKCAKLCPTIVHQIWFFLKKITISINPIGTCHVLFGVSCGLLISCDVIHDYKCVFYPNFYPMRSRKNGPPTFIVTLPSMHAHQS